MANKRKLLSVEEACVIARRSIYHATFHDGASGGVGVSLAALMKIGVPRTCTTKACASCGSGLGSTSRDCIPCGSIPLRPVLTMYCGGAGQGGSVQPNCHHYTSNIFA
ncbi:hypothetical protein IGI04_014379 [Brassica rapa subsp. trilocularis]|uniref:Uncharacterized protein n=1 Tax=Brassica rapa subsp. trilocularis TaxID=1813537 RepID=A0ABQ7MM29_BRACM|nr:hypothetical protein IGI04_014379 [Brassica rapa subsp. trilocularis]